MTNESYATNNYYPETAFECIPISVCKSNIVILLKTSRRIDRHRHEHRHGEFLNRDHSAQSHVFRSLEMQSLPVGLPAVSEECGRVGGRGKYRYTQTQYDARRISPFPPIVRVIVAGRGSSVVGGSRSRGLASVICHLRHRLPP